MKKGRGGRREGGPAILSCAPQRSRRLTKHASRRTSSKVGRKASRACSHTGSRAPHGKGVEGPKALRLLGGRRGVDAGRERGQNLLLHLLRREAVLESTI